MPPALNGRRPLVWVLTPYLVRDGQLIGESYDNEQTKAEIARAFHALGMPWVWQPVVLDSIAGVLAQIVKYRERHETVVFNFCDGDDINGYPGLSLLRALEASGVPFTGARSAFYEISTSKILIKEALVRAAVPTSPWTILPHDGPVDGLCARMGAPLFVKPAVSAEGWGLTLRSVVHTDAEIATCRAELHSGELGPFFSHDTLFVEKFLAGPEFTVFVGGDYARPADLWTLPAVEYTFDPAIPPEHRILCDERFDRAFYRFEPAPPSLVPRLVDLAKRAYCAVQGTGYGRIDIRMDRPGGQFYVLEVNANPGLSGDDELVSVGRMLDLAGLTFADLLGRIIQQASSTSSAASAAAQTAATTHAVPAAVAPASAGRAGTPAGTASGDRLTAPTAKRRLP